MSGKQSCFPLYFFYDFCYLYENSQAILSKNQKYVLVKMLYKRKNLFKNHKKDIENWFTFYEKGVKIKLLVYLLKF